jgi:ubiquinone/menaquinone biosynthesis C-methylase UbiE
MYAVNTINDIEEQNRRAYDRVASEFSDTHRVTTANFHTLSTQFFEAVIGDCRASTRVLELGPGTGFLTTMLQRRFDWLIALDISEKMLKQLGARQGVERRLGSAFDTGLADATIDCVFCSLADPFLRSEALGEAWRVLKQGGTFAFSTPSSAWSSAIRDHPNTTQFIMRSGESVDALSFTYDDDQLLSMLQLGGFVVDRFDVATGAPLVGESVSPAIVQAAQRSGTDLRRLPILQMVVARKVHALEVKYND